jgi:dUTP pyrophosphatase
VAYATLESAAFDVVCQEEITLGPGDRKLVGTGLFISACGALEDGLDCSALLLLSRSSVAFKTGVMVANGVGLIDTDYRDEIKAILFNASGSQVVFPAGSRIAQIMPMNAVRARSLNINNTVRSGGFGSTGQ